MVNLYKSIGLMSGTSLDAIDIALIHTDGEKVVEKIAFSGDEYSKEFRHCLRAILQDYQSYPNVDKDYSRKIEKELTILHAQSVNKFLQSNNIDPKHIDVIGFHGQTVYHNYDIRKTIQLGDGKLLADLTKIDVVNNFRENDVLNGGHGAPLAPVYHYAISSNFEKPIAVINIGGVANISFISDNIENLVSFDTGTGNALIDDYVNKNFGLPFDENGDIASSGKVDKDILNKLLDNQYFSKKPPKSLDRLDFIQSLEFIVNLNKEDAVATLTEFTVQSIVQSLKHFKAESLETIMVCGGGRKNNYIMQRLNTEFKMKVEQIESFGFDGDAIEAEAFAYLAVRSIKDLPLSYPNTTGVNKAISGGYFNKYS